MSGGIVLIFTTVNSKEKAKEMALKLVKNRFAACVSILNAFSTYYWQNKIEQEDEYVLKIKTSEEKVGDVIKWLEKNHPYTVPEIIVVRGEAYGEYYKWLNDYLSEKSESI